MITTSLELTCRDSVVARDGRPFGTNGSNRMRSLSWPTPSMIAGSLRTALGRDSNRDFSPETAHELTEVAVDGFLPYLDDTLYFPAPLDCIPAPESHEPPLRAVPISMAGFGGGTSWPDELALDPVMIPLDAAAEDFKPGAGPAWWPADRYAAWLTGGGIDRFDDRFLCLPEIEERTHVALDEATGAAQDGQLFSTQALVLGALKNFVSQSPVSPTYRIRVRAGGWCHDRAASLSGLHTTGGERRLVHYRTVSDSQAWQCPPTVASALIGASSVRMDLVTPAIFDGGWRPGWLDRSGVGSPPESGLQLRLVGAAVGRWRAISGWSLNPAVARLGRPGPKPIRRTVPAGSVYFFEVLAGNPGVLTSRWLESVSDDVQERRDGFGLATWGIWNRTQVA